MSRRNVWLSFDEWEMICEELSDQKYHSFKLSSHELQDWKEVIQRHRQSNYTSDPPRYCFERVGIFPEVEQVKSSKAINVLCREDWRSQDIYYVMRLKYSFISFITSNCDDVNMNTTLEQWEEIRNTMNDRVNESGQRYWSYDDLIDLYRKVIV